MAKKGYRRKHTTILSTDASIYGPVMDDRYKLRASNLFFRIDCLNSEVMVITINQLSV